MLGVPNAADVLSNLAFLFAGAAGLLFLSTDRSATAFRESRERLPYFFFFAGVCLTAFGSAWYHLAPDHARLVWDRLPMTVAFLSLFAAFLAERVRPDLARRLLASCTGASPSKPAEAICGRMRSSSTTLSWLSAFFWSSTRRASLSGA
jgi:hypothetical protein